MSSNLLIEKRFMPFFLTQFLGAFNDNIYKNTLMIMLTYQALENSALLVNISALLFILPFFLFSSLAGQIGDKFEKSKLIKIIKFFEILIMSLGATFFIIDFTYGLMAVLFLMGTQSAIFGPVKYSIIPQHLKHEELLKGNAIVETGTFIAILLGTIYAGGIIQVEENTAMLVSASVILFAVLGFISSLFIPNAKASNPEHKINYNVFSETFKMIKLMKEQKISVSRSILSISWFWFIGAIFLTQMPLYAKEFLNGDESVVILLLTVFSLSIGFGSMLSEKLTDGDIELGLVPIGALGITIGGVWMYFSTLALPENNTETLLTISEFFSVEGSLSVLAAMFFIGMSGGFYTVPLYTLIQIRTKEKERSRVVAINNIVNSLLMVISAVYSIFALNYLTILELLLSVAILNVFVGIYIFTVVPEFAMRFLVFLILKFMYRIRKKNINIPKKGGLVIVGNHVSYMDALILSAAIPRPMRFVMYYKIFNIPILNFIFKNTKAIPIAGVKENKKVFDAAFDEIAKALDNGEAIFIFPEGRLTTDGEMNVFKSGIEHIIQRTPVPVYTVALQNLWGSFFCKTKGLKIPKRFYSKINVVGGEIVQPENVTKEHLENIVKKLRSDKK